MKLFKQCVLLSMFFFFLTKSFAQNATSNNAGQTSFMMSDGKIFVVLAVVIVIVLGLFLYLFNLDRKITKLEKDTKK